MNKSKCIKQYIENGGRRVWLKTRSGQLITFHSWAEDCYELYFTEKGKTVFCYFRDVDKKRTVKLIETEEFEDSFEITISNGVARCHEKVK